jgi:hypothetical protein
VVYPPADSEFFNLSDTPREEFDFLISAMVPYKKVDLAIRAYTESGYPLKVMGTGSGLPDLQKIAGPNIEFLGRQSDEVLRDHYQRCRFLIFPGEEDYGIVPVEAMACGTPVVATAVGAVPDFVDHPHAGQILLERRDISPPCLRPRISRAAKSSLVGSRAACWRADRTPCSRKSPGRLTCAGNWDLNPSYCLQMTISARSPSSIADASIPSPPAANCSFRRKSPPFSPPRY